MASSIEWTETTWNPVTGCTKVSLGCRNCYAERMAHRLQAMGLEKYRNAFYVTTHPSVLDHPLKWKKPRLVFVNSMSDLFHEQVDEDFVKRVFDIMNRAHHHTFQVLTKRPERVIEMDKCLAWTPNIWMGVSIENTRWQFRLDVLKQTGASVKFLSLEPLLGPLPGIQLNGIDWVIVGGESGPGARPIHSDWVREIRDNCLESDVAFFFKQWGGTVKKRTGRILDGRTWDEMPSILQAEVPHSGKQWDS